MMAKEEVMQEWEKSWSGFEGHRALGNFFLNNARNVTLDLIRKRNNDGRVKIIDVGCGSGDTIRKFRRFGFTDIIGIDHSTSSMRLCQMKGLKINTDIFEIDAFKTGFAAGAFDIVFSEGILEHFADFEPLVREMCRISRRHVLLIQPNHFSAFKKLSDMYYFIFPNKDNVKEFTFNVTDFQQSFRKFGYELAEKRTTFLGAFWVLLFTKADS
jgi:ubiquinone/menaquinone biosynthesis C-methylase UbiE